MSTVSNYSPRLFYGAAMLTSDSENHLVIAHGSSKAVVDQKLCNEILEILGWDPDNKEDPMHNRCLDCDDLTEAVQDEDVGALFVEIKELNVYKDIPSLRPREYQPELNLPEGAMLP